MVTSTGNVDFVVLGGGLAGLTFALEAARRGRQVAVLEGDEQLGGLARTLDFGAFRFDIGGHRYHSVWPEITGWVLDVLDGDVLTVERRSSIRIDGRSVEYPLRFPNALGALSPPRAARVLTSYLKALIPVTRGHLEASFEDWVVRRFGRALYDIYFRPYTEKVLGVPCSELSADWARERIRLEGLSAAAWGRSRRGSEAGPALVSRFLSPPLGIGTLPERIASRLLATGRASVRLGRRVDRLEPVGSGAGWTVFCHTPAGGETVVGRQVVSTIPLGSLLRALPIPAAETAALGEGLAYRSLVCALVEVAGSHIDGDTWTYFPDSGVVFGRTHEPVNWSPQMAPAGHTSLCVEIFCSAGDTIWQREDGDLFDSTLADLERLRVVARERVSGGRLLRVPHAYPIYRIGYAGAVRRVRDRLACWPALHLAGRTGSFQYLNMDGVIRQARELVATLCRPAAG
jgi:protoporphyrinogen oxidase